MKKMCENFTDMALLLLIRFKIVQICLRYDKMGWEGAQDLINYVINVYNNLTARFIKGTIPSS